MAIDGGMEVSVELVGKSALLMHSDDIDGADRLAEWRKAPENKNFSKPGDDRSPPWTWMEYLYGDGERIAMPTANVMAGLRSAGAQVILKRNKTYKELTQAGIIPAGEYMDFFCGEKLRQVSASDLAPLHDLPFAEQKAGCEKLGFSLYAKRARIGQQKHIRVRPRFNQWVVRGRLVITAKEITLDVLQTLFEIAGRGGLGDWRSACKTPGAFGRYVAKITVL